jgi:hypothetical protein
MTRKLLFPALILPLACDPGEDQIPAWQTVTDHTEEIRPGLTLADIRNDATLVHAFYAGLWDKEIHAFRAWRDGNPLADAHEFAKQKRIVAMVDEACDADATNGVDLDGYNVDGIDETEWTAYGAPIAPGWFRCNDHFEGEDPTNVSCAITRGGRVYVDHGDAGVGPGWPWQDNLFQQQVFLFDQVDWKGYCISADQSPSGGYGEVAKMKEITRCTSSFCWNYWGTDGWANKVRSVRYGGNPAGGNQALQFWDANTYSGNVASRTGSAVYGGIEWNVSLTHPGWLANSLKLGHGNPYP